MFGGVPKHDTHKKDPIPKYNDSKRHEKPFDKPYKTCSYKNRPGNQANSVTSAPQDFAATRIYSYQKLQKKRLAECHNLPY